MTKQHWGNDEIGRRAMVDTRKELLLHCGVTDSGRTAEHTERVPESEVIGDTETH